jgi:adenosylhomocysteine nucleosidase
VTLAALDIEALPFSALLTAPSYERSEHRTYVRGLVEGKDGGDIQVVVWPIGGTENVMSGIATYQAITIWNPAYIILSGITGGLHKPDRALGDIVVPEQVVGYEPGKISTETTRPRFEVFRPSLAFLAAAHASASTNWWTHISVRRPAGEDEFPRVHFGILASGEKVVASENWTRDFVDIWPRAVGVEMEALGVSTAAYRADERPGIGVIKAISDWADKARMMTGSLMRFRQQQRL